MSRYLLITIGDKGEARLHWLNDEDLALLLSNPNRDYGVKFFWQEEPVEQPEYWDRCDALLLRVEVLTPQQQVSWVLPQIPQESMRMIDKFLDDPEKLGSYRERPDRLRATWVDAYDDTARVTVSDSPLTQGS